MRLTCRIHLTVALFSIPWMAAASDAPSPILACRAGHADLSEPDGGWDWDSLSASDIEALAQQWRAQKRAQSGWTTRVAAYYSLQREDHARLYLMNGFADSIDVNVTASSRHAEEYPLGTFKLNPRSHIEIDLSEALADAGPDFATGSLRATFVGDSSMILGWVMQRRKAAIANIPLQVISESPDTDGGAIYSYWNTELLNSGTGQPHFYIANPGQVPAEYVVTFSAGGERLSSAPTTLAPFSGAQLTPPADPVPRTGYVEIHPVGAGELPVVVGLLEDEDELVRLPTFQMTDAALGVEYVSMEARLTSEASEFGRSADGTLAVGLFNPSERAQALEVSVIDSATGDTVAEIPVSMGMAEVVSLDLTREIAARSSGPLPEVVYVRVAGEAPFVPPIATLTTRYGAVATIEFHKLSSAHPFGRFAIPRLDENAVWTSILNLGDEPAEVVGQLFWDGCAYAIDPITIEPGMSGSFDFRSIVAKASPDALGRVPSGSLSDAYFHWVRTTGPSTLLGRTYVQPNDSLVPDIEMCEGCCFEIPWATILPFGNDGTANFLPGQTPNAKAAYKYTTCSGQLGPWLISPDDLTVPNPFSWNGVKVGASDPADKEIEGEGPSRWGISLGSCSDFLKLLKWFFQGFTCKHLLIKSYAPGEFFDTGQTCANQILADNPPHKCIACHNCADQIYSYYICSTAFSTQQAIQRLNAEKLNCNAHQFCASTLVPNAASELQLATPTDGEEEAYEHDG